MATAFVYERPAFTPVAGLIQIDFPSGDGVVSVALTRHAMLTLMRDASLAIDKMESEVARPVKLRAQT